MEDLVGVFGVVFLGALLCGVAAFLSWLLGVFVTPELALWTLKSCGVVGGTAAAGVLCCIVVMQ